MTSYADHQLTSPVFDRPLFSPDVTLFENLDIGRPIFSNISREEFFENRWRFRGYRVNTE